MAANIKRKRFTVTIGLLLITVMALSGVYFTSCTDTLKGDANENLKPIVYFVNIPPAGQNFSRNPVVYWYGTDNDGLIDYYRYHVTTVSQLGEMSPEEYISTLSDEITIACDTLLNTPGIGDTTIVCDTVSDWQYVDVDPVSSDPRTAVSVPLKADTSNPVRGFVAQWVFVQAFDMQGLGSDIVYRLFKRNDNPPQTTLIVNPKDIPFVNAPTAGGVITGMRIRWMASDKLDYPQDPPPFEFQWRLYGPYDSLEMIDFNNNFVTDVFVTSDGFVYRLGDTLIRCDTTITDSIPEERCDTFPVDPDTLKNSALGSWQPYVRVDDEDFINSTFNRVADSSFNGIDSWVMNTSDTLYNVYKNYDIDTTSQMNFVFWIRARDDAFVADLAPAFKTDIPVIEPRFERDVAVIDFVNYAGANITTPRNIPGEFSVRGFWADHINNWNPTIIYDSLQDYYLPPGGHTPLNYLLKHKLLILTNDEVQTIGFVQDSKIGEPIFKAIDAGVNVWATWRAPLVGNNKRHADGNVIPPADYSFYFAVRKMVYAGWLCYGEYLFPPETNLDDRDCKTYFRIEDFVGAYSLDSASWPNINLLPDLLKSRYVWDGGGLVTPFVDSLPCLPEVDWSEAGFGAEVLYLYKSLYGADHPLGNNFDGFNFVMEGAPVGHRFNSGLFRTVHFNFTPIAIDTTTGSSSTGDGNSEVQALFNKVLDWLYDPSMTTPVSHIRYPGAKMSLSVSEQRRRYWERNDRAAEEMGWKPGQDEQEFIR